LDVGIATASASADVRPSASPSRRLNAAYRDICAPEVVLELGGFVEAVQRLFAARRRKVVSHAATSTRLERYAELDQRVTVAAATFS